MKTKTLITSLAVMVSALANAAPSVGYEAATNISAYVSGVASNNLDAAKQDKIHDYTTTNVVREIVESQSVTNQGAVAEAKAYTDAAIQVIGGLTPQDVTSAAQVVVSAYDASNITQRISVKYEKPEGGIPMADLSLSVQNTVNSKQNELVSGSNIKTVNGQSLLGGGNIVVASGLNDVMTNGFSAVRDGVANIILNEIGGGGGADTNEVNDLIATYVTTNAATTNLTERLSEKVGQGDVDATLAASNLCTVAEAQAMTNDNTIVRGEYDAYNGIWGINAERSLYSESSGSSCKISNILDGGFSSEFPYVKLENGVLKYFYKDFLLRQPLSKEYAYKENNLSGYGITDAYTKNEIDGTTVTNRGAVVAATNAAEYVVHRDVPAWARSSSKPTYTAGEVTGAMTAIDVANAIESSGHLTSELADAAYYPKESGNLLANQVSVIGSHMNAEDAQCVVTNYDSLTHLPEATFRIKLQQGGTNVWRDIWKEMTRWDAFCGSDFSWATWGGFRSWSTNIEASVESKCPREYAWYDGTTGEVAPDGFFWISQPRIAICAGAAYQRYMDSGNAVWILESNGLAANVGGTTNGYFRISDEEGNAQFEIIKGDKQTVPAISRSMRSETVMGVTHWICDYAVTNAVSPPVAKFTRNLSNQTWIPDTDASCPCNVEWTAGVNTYTLEFWTKSNEAQMFLKSEYDRGGETKIRQNVPCEMQYIILNGTRYGLVPKTVNGELVLGLTTGN